MTVIGFIIFEIFKKGGIIMNKLKSFGKKVFYILTGVVTTIMAFLIYGRINKKATGVIEDLTDAVTGVEPTLA